MLLFLLMNDRRQQHIDSGNSSNSKGEERSSQSTKGRNDLLAENTYRDNLRWALLRLQRLLFLALRAELTRTTNKRLLGLAAAIRERQL